jgi:hypothetical protein
VSRRWQLPAALGCIALATLIPIGAAPPRFDAQVDIADAIVNLALFLPIGLLLERNGWRKSRGILLVVACSIAIEILQGFFVPGRRGSALDVGFNLAGAVAGLHWRRTPPAVPALLLLLWLGSGALLRPSAPETPIWWGQWSHAFAGTVPFQGSILSVRLLGHPVPDGPIDSTGLLVTQAGSDGLSLDVDLLTGKHSNGVTHIAGVSDGEGHVIIALEQSGSDLILAWRSLGATLGLRPPRALFPGFFPPEEGVRLRLRADVTTGSASVTVEPPVPAVMRKLRFTPMSGWRSFVAIPSPRPEWPLLMTALWTALAAGLAAISVLLALRKRKPQVS